MVKNDAQEHTLPDEPEQIAPHDFQPQTLEERVLVELSDAVSSKVFRVRRDERK